MTLAPEHLVLSPNPARTGRGVIAEWRPVPNVEWYRICRDGDEVWAGAATKCHLQAVPGAYTVSAQNSHGYGPESAAVILRTHDAFGFAVAKADDEWSTLLRELYRFAEGAILSFPWSTPVGDPRRKTAAEYVCGAVNGLFGATPQLPFDPAKDNLGNLLRIVIAGNIQADWELLERPRVDEHTAGEFMEKVFRVLDPPPFDAEVLRLYLEGKENAAIADALGVPVGQVDATLRVLTRKLEEHFGPELRGLFDEGDPH